MGKTGRKNKKYSGEFKKCVILDMQEHHLGYSETVRKYWEVEKGHEQNQIKQLKLWERIYSEEGAEGLMAENRGRSKKEGGKKRGRPLKIYEPTKDAKDMTVKELLEENEIMRAQIEYIKKLSALVLADEQKNGKRRS